MTEYIYSILKKYYGYNTFKLGQEEIIKNILADKDVLAVMPTGAGKSVCYQVPAAALGGITLVISPLISLMKDQVVTLNQIGIRAAYLNSTLSYAQYLKALDNASKGMYKIIYVAPERLCTEAFLEFSKSVKISLIAVDEAHCISQWGQDFRPSYLKIAEYINVFNPRPVVAAFTATATEQVKTDIEKILCLNKPFKITTGFDRENLYFAAEKPSDKKEYLLKYLAQNTEKSGIIYCATRKLTEEISGMLLENDYNCGYYHGGMDNLERDKIQEDFTFDRVKIIVATTAFGMGIDKSNVSFVIHFNMPLNIESYYQEAGRAGRDGSKAECILLYSGQDVRLGKFMIENSIKENTEISEKEAIELKTKAENRLRDMTFYATTKNCLRKEMLKYFNENYVGKCNNCSSCLRVDEVVGISAEGLKLVNLISKTGEKYGFNMLCDILVGASNERIFNNGFDKLTEYGSLSGMSRSKILKTAQWLEENEYIEFSTGEYPTISLLLNGRNSLGKIATRKIFNSYSDKDRIIMPDLLLLDKLKVLRRQIADKQSVPAFVIFSDAVLSELAATKPKTKGELIKINGIGAVKSEKYGDKFLEIIQKHCI